MNARRKQKLIQRILRAQAGDMRGFWLLLTQFKKGLAYSDYELADLFHVTPSTIERWLHGDSTPLPHIREDLFQEMLTQVHNNEASHEAL